MKVGDILTGDQLDGLSVGSVVVHDEDGGFNSVTRTPSGFTWVSGRGSNSRTDTFGHGGISVGGWTLVHLPAVPLKVGDMIATLAQAKALPVGTVVVDDEEKVPVCAPAIKVDDGRWLYRNIGKASGDYADDAVILDHRIVHIPEVAA